MSELQISSVSSSTTLTTSSDLPLDDAISLPKTGTKLIEISNSLQNPESNYVNCNDSYPKNDDTTTAAESILKNVNAEKIANSKEVQKSSSSDTEKSERNMNQHEIHPAVPLQTKIPKNDDGSENERIEEIAIKESFEINASPDQTKTETVDNEVIKDNEKISLTPIIASIMQNVKLEMEKDEEMCEKCPKSIEEKKQEADTFEMIKSAENDSVIINHYLTPSASVEFDMNGTVSKSPDHQSIQTTSESSPGATDSWKNATINMNYSFDNGPQSGIQSTTTLQNHQTKIIYNNKTLSELILMKLR